MSVHDIPEEVRVKDLFHHIDMGFLNRRLCLTVLPPKIRDHYIEKAKAGSDHTTVLGNDHSLVTMLLQVCEALKVPTLAEALGLGKPKHLFRSTEHLAPCPEICDRTRVDHLVRLYFDPGKPVHITYHTEHLVSSTGRMTLSEGIDGGYVHSIVGLLHDKGDRFEIEPLVIGSPWYDHPLNGSDASDLMCMGRDLGEILPEDIEQFSKIKEIQVTSPDEWIVVMRTLPEAAVKAAIAHLLCEPTKRDWGGEANDHFSGNLLIRGQRKTAAFLLKGPARGFREMTLDMCGARADQIHRLVKSGADVSIVQHCHLIGEVVRETLRNFTVQPGGGLRKYCLIDGQATYRILKAYSLLPSS
jgi:hypothetical protein